MHPFIYAIPSYLHNIINPLKLISGRSNLILYWFDNKNVVMKVTREHMTASSDHYKRINMLQAIYQTSFPIFLILLLVIQIWVESTKNPV